MNKVVLFVIVSAAVTCATTLVKRQLSAFQLSAGAEEVVGAIAPGFSCEGRIYGYYADVNNACKLFHICTPIVLADGSTFTNIYSFFCGNQTVFDQATLVCAHPEDATPCEQAESFYVVNENFGRTDIPIQK